MLNFTNVTFLIPFMADEHDRLFNLNVVLRYLNLNFNSNILIVEQGVKKSNINYNNYFNLNIDHLLYENPNTFHKTKLYNMGLSLIKTKNTVCLDSDILIPIPQIVEAKNNLDAGINYCFPFNRNYIEITKQLVKERENFLQTYDFERYLSILKYYDSPKKRRNRLTGMIRNCPPGGCLFIQTGIYIDMGMENEDFFGYAPEDAERKHRLKLFGYSTKEVVGDIYHIDHAISHKRIANNDSKKIYNFLISMNKEQLKKYYQNKAYYKQYGVLK
jgi:hypothetical protein